MLEFLRASKLLRPNRENFPAKVVFFCFFCSLLFILSTCRQDTSQSAESIGPDERLQGVYQQSEKEQLIRICATGKSILLQDTPDEELRQQCSLFDNPADTGLWLDLEGWWKTGKDTVFVVRRVQKIERRNREVICR